MFKRHMRRNVNRTGLRTRCVLLALATVGAFLVFTAVPASARAPGVNGQISYDLDGNGVVTANADGTGANLLVPGSCCGGWSPDGSKLAVPYLTDDGRIGTATINADGSGYTPFAIDDPTLNIGCGTGSWAPDGTQLACQVWDNTYPSRGGFDLISAADGSVLRPLTNANGGVDQPGSYSPDGKQLVFLRGDQNGDAMSGAPGLGLFAVKINSGQLRQITPPGTLIQGGNAGDWSLQGNEIIFSRHVTPDVRGSIWVIHADGSGLHEIHIHRLDCGGSAFTPDGVGCHGVRWSPDGKKIIFIANSAAAGKDVYTADADGSDLRQVTHIGNADDPDWGSNPPSTSH
jgi:Tol biopolymer transport system component